VTSTMRHGDYIATIELDEELGLFVGNVINLTSPVMFYGASVDDLAREFATSIEAYLEVCQERGIKPEKPFSGRLNIRVSPELHRTLARIAAAHGKSLNAYALLLLRSAIEHAESQIAPRQRQKTEARDTVDA